MSRLALLLVLSVGALVIEAKLRSSAVRVGPNPGIALQINNCGFDALIKSIAGLASTYAGKAPIPDAKATVGGVDLATKNVRITNFPPPQVVFRMTPPNGFVASLKFPQVEFGGPFDAQRRTLINVQQDKGRFTFTANDVVVNVSVTVGEFDNGVPKIAAFKCASSLGKANLNVRDCKEKYAIDTMTVAASGFRKGYDMLVCSTIENMVTKQLNRFLAQIPNVIDVSPAISFKFQVKPTFGKSCFQTGLYGKTITDLVSPFSPAPFPADAGCDGECDAMVVLKVSDAIFNDVFYQLHSNDKFNFCIDKNTQPIVYNRIRVTCEPGAQFCLGNFAPHLQAKFGENPVVRAVFKASKAPEVEFSQGKATFTAALTFDLFITPANSSQEIHETTATIDVTGLFKVKIIDGTIYALVDTENVVVHIDEEHSQKWEDQIRDAAKEIIHERINKILSSGCPLKLPFGAALTNPVVQFAAHTLLVKTGLAYQAVASAERK